MREGTLYRDGCRKSGDLREEEILLRLPLSCLTVNQSQQLVAGLATHKKGRGCQNIKITVSCFGRCISTISQRASKTKSDCSPETEQLQMPLFALLDDAKGSKYSLHGILHSAPCPLVCCCGHVIETLAENSIPLVFDFIALSKSLRRNQERFIALWYF